MTMKRQTITFSDELEKAIDDSRRKKTPIPSFNQEVLELIVKGLRK